MALTQAELAAITAATTAEVVGLWQFKVAVVAASASLLVVILKWFFDRKERKAREEADAAQNREDRTTNEATLILIEKVKAQLTVQINNFLHLQQWRIQRRQRMLALLEEGNKQLKTTISGLDRLVDRGPTYRDLEMVKETAIVMEMFTKFQETMDGPGIYGPFEDKTIELSDHITTLLLTLSPDQGIRNSEKRKNQLKPLQEKLKVLGKGFTELCRDFDRDPAKYDYGAAEGDSTPFTSPTQAGRTQLPAASNRNATGNR